MQTGDCLHWADGRLHLRSAEATDGICGQPL